MTKCELCPRECGVDRAVEKGFCGATVNLKIARAGLHQWEEPCISGTIGSGTVFFSGCSLKCCFCQNYEISAKNYGKIISIERLSEIFIELQDKGAHNINLVNPTHYVPLIIEALDKVKHKLTIPIVYNCGGYEQVETIEMLKGYVDIYLPDLKYMDSDKANRYSLAANYFEFASKAIISMFNQVGKIKFDKDGILQKGVIIRHLVMPKGHNDSINIIKWISKNFLNEDILVSIMSQYTPCYQSFKYEEINRKVFSYEYRKVIDKLNELGLKGFIQEKSSANEKYTPLFNLEGV